MFLVLEDGILDKNSLQVFIDCEKLFDDLKGYLLSSISIIFFRLPNVLPFFRFLTSRQNFLFGKNLNKVLYSLFSNMVGFSIVNFVYNLELLFHRSFRSIVSWLLIIQLLIVSACLFDRTVKIWAIINVYLRFELNLRCSYNVFRFMEKKRLVKDLIRDVDCLFDTLRSEIQGEARFSLLKRKALQDVADEWQSEVKKCLGKVLRTLSKESTNVVFEMSRTYDPAVGSPTFYNECFDLHDEGMNSVDLIAVEVVCGFNCLEYRANHQCEHLEQKYQWLLARKWRWKEVHNPWDLFGRYSKTLNFSILWFVRRTML